MVEELERKYDVKILSTEDKVKFPDELKAKLKESGMMDDKGKLKLKGVSPKMLKRMKQEFVECPVLKEDIQGPGITKKDVILATEKIVPCFEIVDSRIHDWKIKIQDTIADNASCGIFVLGEGSSSPEKFSMDELEVVVHKNGEFLSSGFGSAVQGHPAEAVAWLANTLGEYDIPLLKGEFILSGSLVPLEPAIAGDSFSLELKGVGTCEINFI